MDLSPTVRHWAQMPDDAIVRPRDACIILGVSSATYWRMLARGDLPRVQPSPGTSGTTAGAIRRLLAGGAR